MDPCGRPPCDSPPLSRLCVSMSLKSDSKRRRDLQRRRRSRCRFVCDARIQIWTRPAVQLSHTFLKYYCYFVFLPKKRRSWLSCVNATVVKWADVWTTSRISYSDTRQVKSSHLGMSDMNFFSISDIVQTLRLRYQPIPIQQGSGGCDVYLIIRID